MRYLNKKRMAGIAAIVAVLSIAVAHSMLLVTITNVGTVVGATAFKELTISAQTSVTVLGAGTKPVCSSLAASAFADVAAVNLNWGTTLQSASKYETFFCLKNIGNVAGTVHVAISGTGATGDGSTIFVYNADSLTAGTPCDGTVLGSNGLVAVEVELDTPTVAAGASIVLASTIALTIS